MALENLFGTSIKSFHEILGNGKSYKVPEFQRDYSWEQEQWQDLFDDLFELYQNTITTSKHYIGSIVLEQPNTDREEYTVIDGQQRLTTLSLLIIAIIYHLEEKIGDDDSKKRASLYKNYINFERSTQLGTYITRLILNRTSNNDYQLYFNKFRFDILLTPRSFNNTVKKMITCFKYFCERIDSSFGHNSLAIAKFVEKMSYDLAFIVITTADTVSSYTIFETLNSRGIALTSADLLKNYILKLCSNDTLELEDAILRWGRISDKVDYKKLPDFIRDYLNTFNPYVRTNQLFNKVKILYQNKQRALELLNELDKYVDFYVALSDYSDDFWSIYKLSGCKPQITHALNVLHIFRLSQYKSLVLACYIKQFNISDIADLLDIIVKLSFRYNKVCGLNPNDIEKLYNEIAIKIINEEATDFEQIVNLLQPMYVKDSVFKDAFIDLELSRNKDFIKYVLGEIERHKTNGTNIIDYSKYTIEHIMPQSKSLDWELMKNEKHKQYLNKIGNLTLLDSSSNNTLDNKWMDKQYIYKNSPLALNNDIATSNIWDIEQIMARSTYLAEDAACIWRVNFKR